jgi:hypothetical protein
MSACATPCRHGSRPIDPQYHRAAIKAVGKATIDEGKEMTPRPEPNQVICKSGRSWEQLIVIAPAIGSIGKGRGQLHGVSAESRPIYG